MVKSILLKSLLLFMLIIFLQEAKGQYKLLYVDHVPQIHATWCWAASIEMIMKYHNPSLGTGYYQPTVFSEYSKMRKWETSHDCSHYCGIPYSIKTNSSAICESKFAIDFSTPNELKLDYMGSLFDALNYRSSEEVNYPTSATPILWESLVKQIDDCRPFIVFIDPAGNSITSNHAIVVKGYNVIGGIKYLIANDPFVECDESTNTLPPPTSMVFPYENFSGTRTQSLQGISVDKVLSVIGNITQNVVFLNDDWNCNTCLPVKNAHGGVTPFTTSPSSSFRAESRTGIGGMNTSSDTIKYDPRGDNLVDKLYTNGNQVIGFNNNTISEDSLTNFLKQAKQFGANVKFLSLNKLDNCIAFFWQNRISKVLQHQVEVKQIVSGQVDTNIVSTFQKNQAGKWMLTKITNHTALRYKKNIRFDSTNAAGPALVLSNKTGEGSIQGSTEYSLIKLSPFSYEFYAFNYRGKHFMSPTMTYKELGIKEGVAYPESKVIGDLRVVSRRFSGDYRKNWKFDIKWNKSKNNALVKNVGLYRGSKK